MFFLVRVRDMFLTVETASSEERYVNNRLVVLPSPDLILSLRAPGNKAVYKSHSVLATAFRRSAIKTSFAALSTRAWRQW